MRLPVSAILMLGSNIGKYMDTKGLEEPVKEICIIQGSMEDNRRNEDRS